MAFRSRHGATTDFYVLHKAQCELLIPILQAHSPETDDLVVLLQSHVTLCEGAILRGSPRSGSRWETLTSQMASILSRYNALLQGTRDAVEAARRSAAL